MIKSINKDINKMNVYIDGSCSHNGKPNAKAGYAVYFGENHPLNEFNRVIGKQSNNTGELTAFIRCLEILEKDINNGVIIHVYTDSEYVIKCASTYGAKLEKKGWESKVPNIDLVTKAYTLYKNRPNIKLHYIKAHTLNTDIHSFGNSEADRLANLAIGRTKDDNDIIKLDISFSRKDQAKELGACWNHEHKYWYVKSDKISDENVIKLLEIQSQQAITPLTETFEPKKESQTKHYIKISFANKDKVKALGARWDPSVKSWYYTDSLSDEQKQKLKEIK